MVSAEILMLYNLPSYIYIYNSKVGLGDLFCCSTKFDRINQYYLIWYANIIKNITVIKSAYENVVNDHYPLYGCERHRVLCEKNLPQHW